MNDDLDKKTEEETVDPVIEEMKTKKEKRLDKKNKRKQDRLEKEKANEKIEKEMQQMIDELSEQMGVNKKEIKLVSIRPPKRDFKYVLLETLYYTILNCAIILGLSGYIKWHSGDLITLLYFALTFTFIELLLRNIIYIFLRKIVVQSFGIVLLLSSLIAVIICPLLPFLAGILSSGKYIVLMIILFIVREAIKKHIAGFRRRIRLNKKK